MLHVAGGIGFSEKHHCMKAIAASGKPIPDAAIAHLANIFLISVSRVDCRFSAFL